jgi:diguanylate cyclase (GGDEF)-like protein
VEGALISIRPTVSSVIGVHPGTSAFIQVSSEFIGIHPSSQEPSAMPTQEGFLTIILIAIVLNLLLAVGLLAGPLIRRRWRDKDDAPDADSSRRVLLRAHLFGGAGDSGAPLPAGVGPANANALFGRPNPSVADLLDPMTEGPGMGSQSSVEPATTDGFEFRPDGVSGGPAEGDERGGERLDVERGDAPERDARDPGASADSVQTDAVTGLDGPSTWAKRLTEENARVQRYGRPATIVLVELAGVDRLAERLGPDAADRLIPPIAMTMRRQARSADSLARLGPTRFAALMPDTDEIKAINYIERVRSACDVWLEAGAVSLRLSIGWAEINANQAVDPAIQAAEQRLNTERHRLRSRDAREADNNRDMAAPLRSVRAN